MDSKYKTLVAKCDRCGNVQEVRAYKEQDPAGVLCWCVCDKCNKSEWILIDRAGTMSILYKMYLCLSCGRRWSVAWNENPDKCPFCDSKEIKEV